MADLGNTAFLVKRALYFEKEIFFFWSTSFSDIVKSKVVIVFYKNIVFVGVLNSEICRIQGFFGITSLFGTNFSELVDKLLSDICLNEFGLVIGG